MTVIRWGYRSLLLVGSEGGQTKRKCSKVPWDRRSHSLWNLALPCLYFGSSGSGPLCGKFLCKRMALLDIRILPGSL